MSSFYHDRPPKRSGAGFIIVAIILLVAGGFAAFLLIENGVFSRSDGEDAASVTAAPPAVTSAPATTVPAPPATQPQTGTPETQSPGGDAATVPPAAQGLDDSDFYNPVVEVAEKCTPSVVGVINNAAVFNRRTGQSEEQRVGLGSGFIITQDGYVITNHHVIDGADTVTVILPEGEEEVAAEVIGSDAITDIAVLKINKTGLPAVTIGDSDNLRVGDMVIAIGNPLALELSGSVSVGYVSALNRTVMSEEGEGYIQTDAAINPGNSGGALFNTRGELVGMPTVKLASSEIEGLGFAIPVNQIRDIANQLMGSGKVDRPEKPRLGVYIAGDMRESQYSPAGVVIAEVMEDSPAEQAGMRAYDVIVSVAGQRTETYEQLQEALNSLSIGNTVDVVIYRNGMELTLSVEFFSMENDE